ncbi:RagB/SusD family nutrient uptake outer membrane protein [Segetibacter sp.]|jgi:hypothetical protein|uniref:RagB/SusD family nutrient uptake outer membrane protein n=1 Tax=Segetibacter sp. TaxID=2231182 RepID=UPI0026200EA7|nr:RagB/SusD family nutrient uptake outer membrane protein [Segetibacter sp.]MCW3081491.1 RagB/SusD family nutrient uptake outer membrane protein [Segetibacter sp.]
MKQLRNKCIISGFLVLLTVVVACKKSFLEKEPLGPIGESTLATKAGVNGLLIGAYSLLDGRGSPGSNEGSAVSNWIYGGVASDDAHKGSEYGDITSIELIESYKVDPTNEYLPIKWGALYAGIQRANDVLRVMAKITDGSLTEAEVKEIKAEAIFLRGVYHLEAAKMWKNVPYIDETVSFENDNYNVSNEPPIYPKIEADFQFAASNLKTVQPQVGRANSWAAKAFLAKVYMFEHKYAEAKSLLSDIVNNGVTSAGQKYQLLANYGENFNPIKKNGSESVFAVQMSVNDRAAGHNGNAGDLLNFPGGGPATCCGFYQPSFSLVNSFKTDPVSGLPLLDTWNGANIKNDMGVDGTASFAPYEGTLDSRLDWTAGRRGIPYLDWGIMPGLPWIRAQAQGGPYVPIKNVYYKADAATTSDIYDGWGAGNVTANNYVMIRFADILLWAAEAEVEAGSLAQAEKYVNQVRSRAANPSGFVHTYVDNNDPSKGFTNQPAANYKVGLYTGQFAQRGQEYARKAVRFERKIELAMEGHRFFDLQRWDNGTGYMADVLNEYIKHETTTYDYQILKGATFKKGRNEYFPVPQNQIDRSKVNGSTVLKQNQGY